MTKSGSSPTGPSEQYLRLLKGDITPEEYARSVEKRVDQLRHGDGSANGKRKTGAQPKRSS